MDRISAFVKEQLGPASAEACSTPEALQRIEARRTGDGLDFEDAILAELFALIKQQDNPVQSELSGEFLHYFLHHMLKMPLTSLYPVVRRMMDTEDVALSVMHDLLPTFTDLEFRSRTAFSSFLLQRLHWKVLDKIRGMNAQSRMETLNVEGALVEDFATSAAPSSVSSAIGHEEQQQLAIALFRLHPRDREMVSMALDGSSRAEIAAKFGIEVEAARKAIERAVRRVRQIATEGGAGA